jgi:hypothetical protein
MERTEPALPALCVVVLLLLGACGKSEDAGGSAALPLESAKAVKETAQPPALAAVNDSLKAGSFDDAAARLLELQASGRNFTPSEAKEYRRALNEAYTKALEAAEKGDARAEAAIKMIRAAGAH